MTAPWVDLTAAILRGTPRLPGALCRGRADLFDSDNDRDALDAAELCGRCPSREPCAAWAAGLRHDEAHGVLAGQHREWIAHPSLRRETATR